MAEKLQEEMLDNADAKEIVDIVYDRELESVALNFKRQKTRSL